MGVAAERPVDRASSRAESAAVRLQRFMVEVEERFIVPVHHSRRSSLWTVAHSVISLPFRVRGELRRYTALAGAERVTLAGVGSEKRFAPILQRLFREIEPAAVGASRPLWRLHPFEHISADLVAVEVHRWVAPRFARAGWLIVPDSVRWQGDLTAVPPAVRSDSLQSDLRKLRKHGYTLEVARGPEDWREFFEAMVLPSARARFGEGAWIPSPGLRRDLAAAGTILFACREGRRVAAACAVRKADLLWVPLIGVRGGEPALIKEGAGAVACAFSVDWAREQGLRGLDWGRTSPFIHDGVQHFNRKWGFHAVPDPITHLTALRLDPRSAAVRRAFAAEPVLVDAGGTLQTYAG